MMAEGGTQGYGETRFLAVKPAYRIGIIYVAGVEEAAGNLFLRNEPKL